MSGFFVFSAVPVEAVNYEPTIGWWQSSNPNSGIAEYSTAQWHSTDYSVHLKAVKGLSPNDYHEVYVANPTGVDSLGALNNVSFWYYCPSGDNVVAPLIDVWLDTNSTFDRAMPPTGDDEWLLGMLVDVTTFDTWVQVTLEDINWVRATGGTVYGLGSAGLTAALTELGNSPILAIGVETGGPGTYISSRVHDQEFYVDDLEVNGTIYPLEPKVINATQIKGYNYIQDAIDVANSGDTINVAAGTYNENQIVIDRALNVIGAGDVSIIDGGDVVNLPDAGLVRIIADGNVTFSGFTLMNVGTDPTNLGNSGTPNHFGIYARSDSSAALYDIGYVKILGTNDVNEQEDYGVYFNSGKESILFHNSIITQTTGNAILVERHAGAVDISDNTLDVGLAGGDAIFVMTYSGTDVTTLQKIHHNTINASIGAGSNAMTFLASGFNQTAGKFSNIQITDNEITGLKADKKGIQLANNALSGSGSIGEISNPVISGNVITGDAGSIGINVRGYISGSAITGNTISSIGKAVMVTALNDAVPTGTTFEGNSLSGNTLSLEWGGGDTFVAKNNWWGAASGPSGVGKGSGDKVSANVDYRPWLLTTAEFDENGNLITETYDQTIAITEERKWALISAPTLLSATSTIIDDATGSITLLAYENGKWVTLTMSTPETEITKQAVSAFYVKTTNKAGIGFNYATGTTPGQTSKDLSVGWNLVGTNNGDHSFAEDEFSSILDTPTQAGMVTLYVPDTYNSRKDFGWLSWEKDADRDLNVRNTANLQRVLSEYDGYWVFMKARMPFEKRL